MVVVVPILDKKHMEIERYNNRMHELVRFLDQYLAEQIRGAKKKKWVRTPYKRRFHCTRFISYRNIRQSAVEILDLKLHKDSPVVIHVTGSNGKGTASFMLQHILRSLGYTVALYNKPHLLYPTERLLINGWPVSPDEYLKEIQETIRDFESYYPGQQLGYLPLLFLAATRLVFTRYNVDFYIVEAGVGLKKDYTNIFRGHPNYYVVITDIALMHKRRLGNSLQEIFDNKNANYKVANRTYLLFDAKNKGITVPSDENIVQISEDKTMAITEPYSMILQNILGPQGIRLYKEAKKGGSTCDDCPQKRRELPFIPTAVFSEKQLITLQQLLEVSVDIVSDTQKRRGKPDNSRGYPLVPIKGKRFGPYDTYAKNSLVIYRSDNDDHIELLSILGVPGASLQSDTVRKTKLLNIKVTEPPVSAYALVPFLPGRFTPLGVDGKHAIVVDNAHSISQYQLLAGVIRRLKARYPIRVRVVFASGKQGYRRKAKTIFNVADEFIDLGFFNWRQILHEKIAGKHRYEFGYGSEYTEFGNRIFEALGLQRGVSTQESVDTYTLTIVTGSVYFVGYVIELLTVREARNSFAPPGFMQGNVYSWIALYRTANWITKIKQFLRFLADAQREEFHAIVSTKYTSRGMSDPITENTQQRLAGLYKEYLQVLNRFYLRLFKLLELQNLVTFLPFKLEPPVDMFTRNVVGHLDSLKQVIMPAFEWAGTLILTKSSVGTAIPGIEVGWRLVAIEPQDYVLLADILRGKKTITDYLPELSTRSRRSHRDVLLSHKSMTMVLYYSLGDFSTTPVRLLGLPKYKRNLTEFQYHSGLGWNELDDKTAVFVPGKVFDLIGSRIGSGAGVYDKYLDGIKYTFVDVLSSCWRSGNLVSATQCPDDSVLSRGTGRTSIAADMIHPQRMERYAESLRMATMLYDTVDIYALVKAIKKAGLPVVLPVRYPFEQVPWLVGWY